jgi:hypothetical protein
MRAVSRPPDTILLQCSCNTKPRANSRVMPTAGAAAGGSSTSWRRKVVAVLAVCVATAARQLQRGLGCSWRLEAVVACGRQQWRHTGRGEGEIGGSGSSFARYDRSKATAAASSDFGSDHSNCNIQGANRWCSVALRPGSQRQLSRRPAEADAVWSWRLR